MKPTIFRHRIRASRAHKAYTLLACMLIFIAVGLPLQRQHAASCSQAETLLRGDTTGLSDEQIASVLANHWLSGQELSHLCPSTSGWIKGYRIERPPVRIGEKQGAPYYFVEFSVRPVFPALESWGTTSGIMDGASGWVEGASLYFSVVREPDGYLFHPETPSQSTSPG